MGEDALFLELNHPGSLRHLCHQITDSVEGKGSVIMFSNASPISTILTACLKFWRVYIENHLNFFHPFHGAPSFTLNKKMGKIP